MITDKQILVSEYFAQNYDSLRRYANAIIKDRNRTYDAEEIVNESYMYLMRSEKMIMAKIDQFCKAWISLTIVKGRSFANLKLSLRNDSGVDRVTDFEDEITPELDDSEFKAIMRVMPKRRSDAIKLLIDAVTIKECCIRTGLSEREMKRELSLARSCFNATRKQLN